MAFNNQQYEQDRERDLMRRALKTRCDVVFDMSKDIIEEHRHNVAKALLEAGVCLIPSDHLQDHQFVVSRGIFEAARKQ